MITGIAEKGASTKLLTDFLAATQVGQVVTYARLSEAAAADVLKQRWVLSSARRALEKRGIVFDAVRSVGIKRVDSAGALGVAVSHGRRAKKALKRGLVVINKAVVVAELTDAQRAALNMTATKMAFASGVMGSKRKVLTEVRVGQPAVKSVVAKMFAPRALRAAAVEPIKEEH